MFDEKIYECEIQKLFLRDGQKLLDWKVVSVRDAIESKALKVRCKDCHGRVKLLGKHVAHGPTPHAVHHSRQDSEYCVAGFYFAQHSGRQPQLSSQPVE